MRREHASYEVSVTPAALDLDALGDDLVMTGNQSAFDFDEALSQDVDEKILLHGTSGQNANDIAMNGFRIRPAMVPCTATVSTLHLQRARAMRQHASIISLRVDARVSER